MGGTGLRPVPFGLRPNGRGVGGILEWDFNHELQEYAKSKEYNTGNGGGMFWQWNGRNDNGFEIIPLPIIPLPKSSRKCAILTDCDAVTRFDVHRSNPEPGVAARRQTAAFIHRHSENAREQSQKRANIWVDPEDGSSSGLYVSSLECGLDVPAIGEIVLIPDDGENIDIDRIYKCPTGEAHHHFEIDR